MMGFGGFDGFGGSGKAPCPPFRLSYTIQEMHLNNLNRDMFKPFRSHRCLFGWYLAACLRICTGFKEVFFRETHLWEQSSRTDKIALITCLKRFNISDACLMIVIWSGSGNGDFQINLENSLSGNLSVPKNRNRRKIAAFSNPKVLNRRVCRRNRRKIAWKSQKKSQKNR